MFESLSEKLESAFKNVSGQGKITELNVAEMMREIRRALLDADVNYEVVKTFTEKVREQALGEKVLTAVSPSQMLVKIVSDELTYLLGGENVGLNKASKSPTVILIAGLQGSGKTTFVGKLSYLLKSKGSNPLVAAADVYRPAAVQQLKSVAGGVGVPVFSIEQDGVPVQDAVRVAKEALAEAQSKGNDYLIIDTAGRLAVDEAMMQEVENIKKAVNPDEILFVVDAMTGQDAVNTAKAFNDRLDFDGVVLTKLDGDTRGGAALSIRSIVHKPIKFASTGEKPDALIPFHPERMAQRILGMGDIVSFVEKAQEQFDEKQAQRLEQKMRSLEFDFQDMYDQLQRVKKMGSMKDLLGMIPGLGAQIKDVEIEEDAFKHIEALILAMTPEERQKPHILNGPRRKRIASGAGLQVSDVNNLIKQFDQMKKMMKTMNKLQSSKRQMNMQNLMGGRRFR